MANFQLDMSRPLTPVGLPKELKATFIDIQARAKDGSRNPPMTITREVSR